MSDLPEPAGPAPTPSAPADAIADAIAAAAPPVPAVPAEPAAADDEFGARIAAGYATKGPAIDLGRAVLDGTVHPQGVVQVPLSMVNRHGLVAGATGTGKTVTLQLMAEQLSAAGVPVFTADIKGDLTGLVKAAALGNPHIDQRVSELGLTWSPAGNPVSFWSLGGFGPGIPARATIGEFGPQLIAKALSSNDTQRSSLALVFTYADQRQLPLLDLADLQAVLQFLTSDEGKDELKTIGGLSPQTAGVLLRDIVELAGQGAEAFLGEPALEFEELLRVTPDGHGVISCLELAAVQDKPKLYSTFLMWLLASLFEHLPEVGDLDKPKLVFFFDEAHLLFDDASKEFVDQVAQTVRLIRSRGVGVFFVTQLPDDVPDAVLAQLGNRVQHGLRAFTPRDAKALKSTVTTFPTTKDYDLGSALTQLGIGEAIVTLLSERGAPTPVAWTRLRPPTSQIGAVDPGEVTTLAQADALFAAHATEIDRDSARERLAARMAATAAPTAPPAAAPPAAAPPAAPGIDVSVPPPPKREPAPGRSKAKDDGNVVTDYLKSPQGRSMMNTVVRGVFGLLKKRR